MAASKNIVIAILAITSAGVGLLAWRQHRELVGLRAAAVSPSERADWQKRVWAAEKQRAESEAKVAATERVDAPPPANAPAPVGAPPPEGRGFQQNFGAMMENPDVQRLLGLQQKAALDGRYAELFKSLHLSPAQLEQFKNLLVEKSTAMMDVLTAARAQGVNPRSDRATFQKLLDDAQNDIDASIRTTLGEAGYASYRDYESTLPQRAVLDQLQQRLSYSATPLTEQQSQQLLQILATTAPASSNATPVRTMATIASGNNARATLTDATITQSLGVLAAPQVDALRQIQEEQRAQAALAAAFRAQARAGRDASGATAGTPSPPPSPPRTPGGG